MSATISLPSSLCNQPSAACWEATGGTPFLVRTLVEALRDEHITPVAASAASVQNVANATLDRWAMLLLVRLAEAAAMRRLMRAHKPALWAGLWLLPLRDLLSFLVFVLAFTGQRIEWRGVRLKVARDGAMAAS